MCSTQHDHSATSSPVLVFARDRLRCLFPHCLQIIAGIFLLIAALLKIRQAPLILLSDGILGSAPILYMAISLEVASGVAICSTAYPLARRCIIVTYATLSLASAVAALEGWDCNCLGQDTPPGVMLPINLVILGLTASLKGEFKELNWRTKPSRLICASLLSCLVAVGVTHLRIAAADDTPDIKYLLADRMKGKRWPQMQGLEHHLTKGRWAIVIVRPDCDHCQQLIELISKRLSSNCLK